jgi:general secretion pathway protein B
MSFILDALKKSESERQRQSGPGVFQPRIASPRTRFPLWALAIGALLGVNLLVLIWLMTRPDDLPATPAAVRPSARAPAAAAAPVATTPAPGTPPATIPAAAPSAAGPAIGAATPFNPPLIVDPSLTTPAPAGAPGGTASNPNDYLPAQQPGNAGPGTTTAVGAGLGGTATASFATRESLLARGQQVPEASLSLHVYDAEPSRRFVFVNGQRGVEGDTLPNGLRIEQIVPEGVVLAWNGNRFLVALQ